MLLSYCVCSVCNLGFTVGEIVLFVVTEPSSLSIEVTPVHSGCVNEDDVG